MFDGLRDWFYMLVRIGRIFRELDMYSECIQEWETHTIMLHKRVLQIELRLNKLEQVKENSDADVHISRSED